MHGFRSSFRVWCSEVAKIEFELAELCLSHRIGNKGYNRTTMLERRARIMVGWANYVCGSDADNVIPPPSDTRWWAIAVKQPFA